MLFQKSLTAAAALAAFCTSFTEAGSTGGIKYTGVGFSGSYKDVISMDDSSCSCQQEDHSFSGTFAPLDEELSVHFRGPVKLLQFGVYYPAGSPQKKRDLSAVEDGDCTETVAKHKHRRDVAVEYKEVTSTLVVPYSGEAQPTGGAPASGSGSAHAVVSTVLATAPASGSSSPSGSASVDATGAFASPAPGVGAFASVASSGSSAATSGSSSAAPSSGSSAPASSSSSSSSSASAPASSSSSAPSSSSSGSSSGGSGSWSRSAYYTPGSADGCVFMNHQGGSGSGVWDMCFGNSISFAGEDGKSAASSATALGEVTFNSDEEFMIFSDESCSGNDCGYYREGIPAYHGFGGSDKIFVFEFTMPTDSTSGFNSDMPAIWLLNAKIPRTLQYGNQECSCWKTGCGELDLFEVLSSGSDQLISHLHDGQGSGTDSNAGGGGPTDYFTRPTETSLKAAVIFNSNANTIQLVQVDDDFGSSLDSSTVNGWLNKAASKAILM
ncbi:hypothetical protein ZYGR_0S02830 [Zygosaccharomyces rouxii]|uniref:glucan endo-1,3-beta-D-glucosidase n=2 Tax=Zygosaccharomyces rouxii TaxID=4956 RepID=C5DXY8_ZYGRC|nr:uncharacterized protein ZYRO0F08844g [Zygosaccharomyces rouxii]KAH9199406.1 putative TOS1-like glycosyl hydrolase-domain-containing protein [Zygosaccharomyces rouxii]GAV50149.1 hypothetical protein ZYGR_0S02830 [Zygosaccharomyces rouxii]CAR28649.1 ZYRO0F08844p [Zygosaccharomyces rouxii]